MLKAKVAGLSKHFGFEVIPSWRMEQFELANHLQNLFTLLNIQCVLDVGANKGQYRDFLRAHVGYKGLIVSFEPVKSLAKHLESRSQSDDNWKIFPFALGSQDTELPINVMATDQFT